MKTPARMRSFVENTSARAEGGALSCSSVSCETITGASNAPPMKATGAKMVNERFGLSSPKVKVVNADALVVSRPATAAEIVAAR